MKVALILCPSWDSAYPNASLALLSALLKERGHEPEVIDLNHRMALLERASEALVPAPPGRLAHYGGSRSIGTGSLLSYGDWLESVVERLSSSEVRLVGFSLFTSNLEASYAVARMLKRRRPDVKIVFGGRSCLEFKECLEHLKQDCVDVVVLGEADLTFPRLVDALSTTGRLEAAPGVLLREDSSTWIEAQDILETSTSSLMRTTTATGRWTAIAARSSTRPEAASASASTARTGGKCPSAS